MRKPAKTAAVLIGLGVGAAVGPSLGPAAVWAGAAVASLGVALSLVGTKESDLVADGLADRDEDTVVVGDGTTAETEPRRRDRQRPTGSGLGTRVEQILELAEQQANDHRAEARLENERIVTAARQEAAAILICRSGPGRVGYMSPRTRLSMALYPLGSLSGVKLKSPAIKSDGFVKSCSGQGVNRSVVAPDMAQGTWVR